VLYIGDEIRDYQAATEAGCAFGAVSWGYTRADALAARTPAHLFTDAAAIGRAIVSAPPQGIGKCTARPPAGLPLAPSARHVNVD
jgi:phosphoglycolate phosphatase